MQYTKRIQLVLLAGAVKLCNFCALKQQHSFCGGVSFTVRGFTDSYAAGLFDDTRVLFLCSALFF